MDKVRRDKRKEVHTRLDFAESSETCLDRAEQALGILPALEVVPLVETAPDTEITSATLKSRTMVSIPPKGLGPSTEDPLEIDVDLGARGDGEKTNLHRLADLKAAPVTRAIGKSESKRPYAREDLAVPWSCEDVDPFTPRIHNFRSSRKTRMSNNVKTYDGTGDPEDHLKVFQASAQVERWAMPTWCHMFNSTLIGAARVWFDELPPESIDSYKDLKAAFLAYFMQQKKHVKDPVEIHNIKQKDGETIEEFMERFKVETGRMKGAPECMKISGFMHGVNNPELTKRLNEHVPKTLEEMMTTTAAFIRGETAAASKKKVHTPWKPQDQSKRHNSERRSDFRNQPRDGRGLSKFTPLNRTPKEIFAAESEKFKPPPPMNSSIEELPWHRVTRQKVTLSFAQVNEITFPPLSANKGTEGPLVIEAEIGGHAVHRMYVDGGSSMEILYEHCFNRLRPEIKSQMVPATTSLTGFSGETIWPLGQLRLLVTIGDAEHFTKAWMNFMIVRSPSPYNGIIGRPGIREIQAVPSTAHGMLKFPVDGGVVTIRSTILMPNECATITATSKDSMKKIEGGQENVKVAIHHDFPDQEGYHDRQPNTDSISETDILRSDKKEGPGSGTGQGHPGRARRQLENVRKLYESKQGLPTGLLPTPGD
ncbi:reverse transcriptase domain-containing protein [Tanacetum coccineum]